MVVKREDVLVESPSAPPNDSHDEQMPERNFLRQMPVFLTADQRPLWLEGLYRDRSAFLIASGPSFASVNYSLLHAPGVLTMGLNNSVKTFRPNLWVCVDDPDHFVRSVWLDPTVLKFMSFPPIFCAPWFEKGGKLSIHDLSLTVASALSSARLLDLPNVDWTT